MKILSVQIILPADRRRAGVLKLYTDMQPELFVAPCLGLGTGHRQLNPRRDPARRFGNTPIGRYKPAVVIDRGARMAGKPPYGRFVIPLVPEDIAVSARRSGLMIHGGRGNARLMVTRGCIRMLDIDIARLAKVTAGAALQISIFERPAPVDSQFEQVLAYVRGLSREKRQRLLALLQ